MAGEDSVILFHGDRHVHTCAEVLNIWNAGFQVLLTGGNGTWVKGAIMEKVVSVALFKNKLHLDIVKDHIKKWLIERIQDPTDSRFYRGYNLKPAPESQTLPAPTTPAAKTAGVLRSPGVASSPTHAAITGSYDTESLEQD